MSPATHESSAIRGIPGARTPARAVCGELAAVDRNGHARGSPQRTRASAPSRVHSRCAAHAHRGWKPSIGPPERLLMPDNPLFRQAITVAAAENPYARLGFRSNPFPEKPGVVPDSEDARSNGTIYVEEARASEQAQFENLLIPRP